MSEPACAIVGVGPGNGLAFARRFAKAGQKTALLARSEESLEKWASEIDGARAFPCDATDAASLAGALDRVHQTLGAVTTLVYNAGAGMWGTVDEVEPEAMRGAFDLNVVGLLVAAKSVLPSMREAGGGNIVVIGATASLRGGARFTAFAAAKAAQRSLAQSIARHVGPEGIHVSLVIIDGVIASERTKNMLPDRPEEQFLSSDDIAESVFFLTQQPSSAWTFELDLRPKNESW